MGSRQWAVGSGQSLTGYARPSSIAEAVAGGLGISRSHCLLRLGLLLRLRLLLLLGLLVADREDVGRRDGDEVVAGLPLGGAELDGRLEEPRDGRGDLRLEPQQLVAVEGRGEELHLVEP